MGCPQDVTAPASPGQADAQQGRTAELLADMHRKQDELLSSAVASALLAEQMQLPAMPGAQSALSEHETRAVGVPAAAAAAAAMVASPEQAAAGGEPAAAMVRQAWTERASSIVSAPERAAPVRAAVRQGAQWVAAVSSAVDLVVDANMGPLTEHLRTITSDNCAAAVRRLQSAARPVTKEAAAQSAAQVLDSLSRAVGDVEQQFVDGLQESVQKQAALQMGPALLRELCDTAVRHRCDALRGMLTLEDLQERVWMEVSVMQGFTQRVGEQGVDRWLSDLLSQKTSLDLPAGLLEFATVEVARHLDPFIDGDATRFDSSACPPLLEHMKASEPLPNIHPAPAVPADTRRLLAVAVPRPTWGQRASRAARHSPGAVRLPRHRSLQRGPGIQRACDGSGAIARAGPRTPDSHRRSGQGCRGGRAAGFRRAHRDPRHADHRSARRGARSPTCAAATREPHRDERQARSGQPSGRRRP